MYATLTQLSKAPQHLKATVGLGVLIRLALLFTVTPVLHTTHFLPFLNHWADGNFFDPWTSWIATGGREDAFPYGLPYLFVFGPLTAIGNALGGGSLGLFALGVTVLFLDVALALTLYLLHPHKSARYSVYLYWLNPAIIYVCYWHGQLDVLPVLLVMGGFLLFHRKEFGLAGLLLGLAASAKFAMALAIPFILVACIRDKRLQGQIHPLIAGLMMGLVPFALAALLPGFHVMALGTPETAKLLAASIEVTSEVYIYILPLALAGLVLLTWRIGRQNTPITLAFTGLAFLTTYLLTPASPGWTLWVIPFLAILISSSSRNTQILFGIFSALTVGYHALNATGGMMLWANQEHVFSNWPLVGGLVDLRSALMSGIIATGLLLFGQVLRDSILISKFYVNSRIPFSIGIAGDSGTGKDTLATALEGLFGKQRVAHLSGDDYHSWDRNKPMWHALTHLNPRANHLGVFFKDIVSVISGQSVTKRHYDHGIGRMTRPYRQSSGDLVIASGLHALLNETVNRQLDVRIFLDMDESLRRALKIRRDVTVRGHPLAHVLASMERRKTDAERFILPQKTQADIQFCLAALRQEDLRDAELGRGDQSQTIDTRLRVGVREKEIAIALQDRLATAVDASVFPLATEDGWHWLEFESVAMAQATEFGGRIMADEMHEFLALEPQWQPGISGIMQLIVLYYLSYRRDLKAS